jgi:hypothetical protein
MPPYAGSSERQYWEEVISKKPLRKKPTQQQCLGGLNPSVELWSMIQGCWIDRPELRLTMKHVLACLGIDVSTIYQLTKPPHFGFKSSHNCRRFSHWLTSYGYRILTERYHQTLAGPTGSYPLVKVLWLKSGTVRRSTGVFATRVVCSDVRIKLLVTHAHPLISPTVDLSPSPEDIKQCVLLRVQARNECRFSLISRRANISLKNASRSGPCG